MVTGAYFPEISGAGLQCRTLIRAAKGDGFSFSVVTTCLDKTLPFRDSVEGVPVYRLPAGARGRLGTLCCWLPKLFYLFFKELLRADVIHLHGISLKSYFFLTVGFIFKKLVLLKMTSLGEDDPAYIRQRSRLRAFFFRLADYYLAPSPALEKAYRKQGSRPERLFYLPNGVDTRRFCPVTEDEKRDLRSQLGLPPDELLIIFTGHYSLDKRPHFLVEVWSELKITGVGLVLLGSSAPGSFEVSPEVVRRVNEIAEKSPLPGHLITVQYAGRIEDYYRAGDIFALPSVREGMPNALLEAMASGLACVATRLEGITDILFRKENCGILFQADSREELGEAIEKLVEDPALRKELGAKARAKVCADYDIHRLARNYRDFVSRAARA
ncbi:MAG TPA: glycosyltransferase family 4 protein [archaeon]|nr:glycosyltransferase family 4 protein [archaeon]